MIVYSYFTKDYWLSFESCILFIEMPSLEIDYIRHIESDNIISKQALLCIRKSENSILNKAASYFIMFFVKTS